MEGLREPLIAGGRELFVRASIGVALGTSRQKSAEEIPRDADTAMYEAKEERLGYRVFDPIMYERAVGRLEMENELRRAIEADEFVLRYQPIASLQTGEVWGMEVIAEGVESEAKATLLKEMGCDLAQGFHFSEPLSPEAATRFLAQERG